MIIINYRSLLKVKQSCLEDLYTIAEILNVEVKDILTKEKIMAQSIEPNIADLANGWLRK